MRFLKKSRNLRELKVIFQSSLNRPMAIKPRKKHLFFLLLILFLILGFFTFFGDKGVLHLLRLQKELTKIKEANMKMEEENRKLKEEVRRLQYDKRYIEEIARKELGMVKEGEIIYQFDLPKEKNE
jgi:cell division protein FtsL